MPSRFKRLSSLASVAAVAVWGLTGCTTHSSKVLKAITALHAGDSSGALAWSDELKQSRSDQQLGRMECGRVKMLTGDFVGSRAEFATVLDRMITESESGPVVKVGAVGAAVVASTVADDTVRAYEPAPYELIQTLHYQTLNYLFAGDREGAGVEARRTVFAQDQIAERYAKEVAKAQQEADASHEKAMGAVTNKFAAMAPVLDRTRSSYENGLAWYFCGLMFEAQGDAANAALSYRKAWELAPQNPTVMRDFFRLLRTQDTQTFEALAAQHHIDAATLTRSQTEIVVLYEEGLISRRLTVKIPIPIGLTLVAVDFPYYDDPVYMPAPLEITAEGAAVGTTAPAVYLQSLAYRDLRDKIPGVVIRNVTRAATRVAAQQIANHSGNNYMKYGVMLANAASSLATTSDTRAWYLIPMVTHLYRGPVKPGPHTLRFRNTATGAVLEVPVTVAAGETRLIWLADPGGFRCVATAPLAGSGEPPVYQRLLSQP
jgi:hypothetical protein